MGEFKIYTKTGDAGQTSLVGGNRVAKNHERINAYGTVDELNVFVGSLRDQLEQEDIIKELILIQQNLFVLGSLLAYDGGRDVKLQELNENDIKNLEDSIDKMVALIPPLRNFILPGGHTAVSACHICRVVCRRAERLVISLMENFDINSVHLKYLNRLSDYFFILSRRIAQINGVEETPWIARKD